MSQSLPTPQKKRIKTSKIPDPGNAMLLLYTMAILIFLLWGGIARAEVEELHRKTDFQPEAVRQGELLVPTAGGDTVPAPLLSQNVEIRVSGIVARVLVTQEFINDGSEWVDAVYVFPLPDESAVDRLRMRVGARMITGVIREREEARAMHEQARREGRKSSLLAQNRPNIFTTRVANIGPGERVVIEMEYQQVVHYADSVFSLRFPMVVGPRYIPGNRVPVDREVRGIAFSGEGWAADTDEVPDASQITPPVVGVQDQPGNPVQLSVELVSGFSLGRIDSLYHTMNIQERENGQYQLTFTGQVKADRDFVLEWQAEQASMTEAALFAEQFGGEQYMLLMLMPPQGEQQQYLPREVIFILDVSGSMAGTSILQAKAAIRQALAKLQPTDRFNVITFSNTAHALFRQPQSGEPESIAAALAHVEKLKADGGTEMESALHLALDGGATHERIRQVVFLTDGAVGNEAHLFELITERLGDSRLFTVGIGSAPNSYFMTRAATMGRGTYTYIGKVTEVQDKMADLFAKLENPVISDIQLRSVNGETEAMEVYPSPLPDLYQGEPLVVALRTHGPARTLHLSGKIQGKSWGYYVDTTTNGNRPGIAALWARKKIRAEMESLAFGADPEAVRREVLKISLEHQLVSKYTSLVAVDSMVSRPPGKNSRQAVAKTNLPHGWQASSIFAGGSQTATSSTLYMVAGLILLVFAALLLFSRPWICREQF